MDIKTLFKNEESRKVLLFFNENPHSIDTVKGISVWIDCELEAVQKALSRLVRHGILVNHKTASTDAYSYTNQRDIIKKIDVYIKKVK